MLTTRQLYCGPEQVPAQIQYVSFQVALGLKHLHLSREQVFSVRKPPAHWLAIAHRELSMCYVILTENSIRLRLITDMSRPPALVPLAWTSQARYPPPVPVDPPDPLQCHVPEGM